MQKWYALEKGPWSYDGVKIVFSILLLKPSTWNCRTQRFLFDLKLRNSLKCVGGTNYKICFKPSRDK